MDQAQGKIWSHEDSGLFLSPICLAAFKMQDFKFVSEYNSVLFDIVTQLELCAVKVSEAEMLKKTFSTFHASNIILQQ